MIPLKINPKFDMRASVLHLRTGKPTYLLTGMLSCLLVLATNLANAQRLPLVDPASVGMNAEGLSRVESLVQTAIKDGKMPGCVICVGRQGKIAYLEAFGNRQILPQSLPMQTNTLFDLASLTKPVATATAVMMLVDQGKLSIEDLVVKHLPEFAPNGKDKISVQQLLIHQSGLTPDNALSDYLDGPELAWQRICELKLIAPIGETFKYSDVNFIVLGKLVEKLSGKSLDDFVKDEIYQPLGMLETGFNPASDLAERAAVTQQRNGNWMRGEVHDPRAYELNGVAGHAGLFSTAEDLAIYAQMMLRRGSLERETHAGNSDTSEATRAFKVFGDQTFAQMTKCYQVSGGVRGLGWDKQTGFSSNKGSKLSDAAFGHGGFTGTVLWIDPKLDLFFIFLSNRVHPDGKGSVNHLAGEIADVIVDSLADRTQPLGVRLGIDVLKDAGFESLRGKRVGLITNHTGRDSDGNSTVQLLNDAEAVNLIALFSPEHGFKGELDVSKISDTQDSKTGLTVYSLYGETRRPTAAMLADLDVMVFDIQDIGSRFYTYVSTMGEAMKASAEQGIRFVVLDRPNPINGVTITGPMLDSGKESFVGYHTIPVRHGMTAGELAVMLNAELGLNLELEIIRCEGWDRSEHWDATNLLWVNPSPNMRSLTQALLYPGVGLLEMTNLSVGRGTDTPFEVIGAPWIEPRELAYRLNQQKLPGVTFVPIEMTPSSSKYADERCGGVNIVITNREQFQAVKTGLSIAVQLRSLYPKHWETKNFDRLLCSDSVFQAVVDGESLESVMTKANAGVAEFSERRAKFLLY